MSTFQIRLNGEKLQVNGHSINGQQVLALGGLEPPEDFELLIKLNEKGFEPVQLDEVIDLREPGIEGFHAKPYRKIVVEVDGQPLEIEELFSTPKEILVMIGKDPGQYFLNQTIGEREIGYQHDVDHKLAIRNGQVFKSYAIEKSTTIIVNARPHEVHGKEISYNEVVTLAFPDFPQHPERTYSVTYERGHGNKPEGILSPGGSVKVKNKMVFRVKFTGQS